MVGSKYLEIARVINERIKCGTYPMFGKIPSETTLMRQFGVARETVRRALEELEQSNVIRRRRGCGTFVRRFKTEGPMPKIGMIVTGGKYSRRFPMLSVEMIRLAYSEGFQLLVENVACGEEGADERIVAAFRRMAKEGARGIIYQPRACDCTSGMVRRCLIDEITLPTVLVGGEIRTVAGARRFDTVDIDGFEAGRILAWHFRRKGCARAVVLCGHEHADLLQQRVFGLKSVLGDAKDKACEVVLIPPDRYSSIEQKACDNDKYCLVAFENWDEDSWTRQSLTALKFKCFEVMREALWRLSHRLSDPTLSPATIRLPTTLERIELCGGSKKVRSQLLSR